MFFDILPVVRYDTAGFFVLRGLLVKRAGGCQSGASRYKNMTETGSVRGESKEESQEFMKKLHTYIGNYWYGYLFAICSMIIGDRTGYGLSTDHTADRG